MRTPTQRGFSLVEILIVVAIASAIVFVVSGLGSNTNVLNTLVDQELQSKANVDQALQVMTTQVRSATQSANGSYPIASAGASTFIFYTNGGNSGVVERVRYFLSSSTIFAGTIQPTGTPAVYPTSSEAITDMIDNVSVPASTSLFLYYNDSYAGSTSSAMTSTADVTPIRLVGISFSVTASSSQTPAPQYFSRFVDIRNLRDQL
jgi:prepilin-type N-terminal cleavage/methylation domain-containing protein